MSRELQRDYSTNSSPEDELRHIRWFLLRVYATALVLSIPAGVIIAILTKNPLPGLIPAPLLLSMRPMIHWAFPRSSDKSKDTSVIHEMIKLRRKANDDFGG